MTMPKAATDTQAAYAGFAIYADDLLTNDNHVTPTVKFVELVALITGVILFSPVVLNLLLTAGFVCLVASTLFRFSSESATGLINHYRATSSQKYSYKY